MQIATLLVASLDAEGSFQYKLWLYERREDAEQMAETIREAFETDESGAKLLAVAVDEKFVTSLSS